MVSSSIAVFNRESESPSTATGIDCSLSTRKDLKLETLVSGAGSRAPFRDLSMSCA